MKKILKYLSKLILSGVISLVILSLFAMVYYNPPVADVQLDKTTNNKFIPNKNWSYMLEGFGWGKTDESGYNNGYSSDISNPDVVVVGSSHIEALQVPANKNCVYLLNEMFDKDKQSYNDFKCFNLGMSAHFLDLSLSNFKNIASKYNNAKYIVIETFDVEFLPLHIDKIINEELYMPYIEKGFISKTVRSVPYLRLLYKKIQETGTNKLEASDTYEKNNVKTYTEKMNIVLEKVSEISKEYGFEVLIFMHDRIHPDENGNVVCEKDALYKNAFKNCCKQNNIEVLDVTDAFISHYNESYEYPYGFANTVPGEGHLNTVGHKIIADKLYNKINELAVKE